MDKKKRSLKSTDQVGRGDGRRARPENDAAIKRPRAMETDEERKARLEKMVATTQLRLALETEEERRAKKKEWI